MLTLRRVMLTTTRIPENDPELIERTQEVLKIFVERFVKSSYETKGYVKTIVQNS